MKIPITCEREFEVTKDAVGVRLEGKVEVIVDLPRRRMAMPSACDRIAG